MSSIWIPDGFQMDVMDHLRSLSGIPFNVEGRSIRFFAFVAQQTAFREGLRLMDALATIAFIDAKFATAARSRKERER